MTYMRVITVIGLIVTIVIWLAKIFVIKTAKESQYVRMWTITLTNLPKFGLSEIGPTDYMAHCLP